MKPRLIHPIVIRLYRRAETGTDPDLGPTGEITWQEPIALPGQISYVAMDRMTPRGSGNDPVSDGHVVFYAADWCGAVGDEMETPSSISRLVVVEARPCGHYGGTPHLVKVYFARLKATL